MAIKNITLPGSDEKIPVGLQVFDKTEEEWNELSTEEKIKWDFVILENTLNKVDKVAGNLTPLISFDKEQIENASKNADEAKEAAETAQLTVTALYSKVVDCVKKENTTTLLPTFSFRMNLWRHDSSAAELQAYVDAQIKSFKNFLEEYEGRIASVTLARRTETGLSDTAFCDSGHYLTWLSPAATSPRAYNDTMSNKAFHFGGVVGSGRMALEDCYGTGILSVEFFEDRYFSAVYNGFSSPSSTGTEVYGVSFSTNGGNWQNININECGYDILTEWSDVYNAIENPQDVNLLTDFQIDFYVF